MRYFPPPRRFIHIFFPPGMMVYALTSHPKSNVEKELKWKIKTETTKQSSEGFTQDRHSLKPIRM